MPTVTVPSPVIDRRLCARDALKIELGIAADDTTFDDWLDAECLSASDRLAEACRVVGDAAGTAPPTFAEETAVITFAADEVRGEDVLFLPWRQPATVTAVMVAGTVLDPSLYRASPKSGLVERLTASGRRACWSGAVTAVTVRSGWPADKVPTVLQDGVKKLVRLRWEAKDRDLAVKAEETADVGRTEYWVGGMGAGGSAIPADLLSALQAARLVNPTIG